MNLGPAEIFAVLGFLFGLVPLAVMIYLVVALFRRLDRIVAASESTAEAVRRLEQRGGTAL